VLNKSSSRITVTYYLEASPGGKGYVTVYQVPGGRVFKLEKTEVFFPSATNFELLLALYHGIAQVAPQKDKWRGDDMTLNDKTTYTWLANEPILLGYENLNTAETKKAQLTVTGLLE